MVRSERNKTMILTDDDRATLSLSNDALTDGNHIINANFFEQSKELYGKEMFDLIIIDPPYNLTKVYNGTKFGKMEDQEYVEYSYSILKKCVSMLKPTGTLYICGDYHTSYLQRVAIEKLESLGKCICRTRLTWARDKGRASTTMWKNNIEDIWMVTKGEQYTFNADAVKIKKQVKAPYKNADSTNRDWELDEETGQPVRMTGCSNIWSDITIPFWSMPENTEHPTQKPEKLYARLMLASTNEGDLVYEPFAGVCTAGVVAKKLGRRSISVELEKEYCLLGQKRLSLANTDKHIQGIS